MMCGISGIVLRKSKQIDYKRLECMTGVISHRGPDATGYFLEHHVGLGHRRLKIIDREGGIQPLYNEDKTVVVVYNGEIYNFIELRKELLEKGHIFQTYSDTEVIVHAYEEYGIDCPKKFRGMFAFAIYDRKKDFIFLARDQVGIKPLYYYVDEDQLLFGSEIKAILAGVLSRPSVNIDMLDFYFSLGYVPGEETLFQGIKKLRPGHILLMEEGRVHLEKYWDLDDAPILDISFVDAQERFEQLFIDCVQRQLMSEVPLGAFLSGGLDSSSIVACMSRLLEEPVQTFSVGYVDDQESCELAYARKISQHFQTEHHEYILHAQDFFESLDLLLEHVEEPIVESAAVALYQLSRLAKEHVTVILSGEGGDELLAGYPLYQIMHQVNRLHQVLRYVPSSLFHSITTCFKNIEKRAKYCDWLHLPLRQRYWGISNDVTASIKASMYHEALQAQRTDAVESYFQNLFDTLQQSTPLRKMSYVDIKSWLPDNLLLKADKMTMAHSLELRVPFLDHQLLEFAIALPDHYRLNGRQGKYLLKKVMEKYLPHEIIYRKKKGFPVPIATWLRGELYTKVQEILLDYRSISRQYFKKNYIERVLYRHRMGKEDLSRRIFAMVTLEMWHRKYID